MHLILIVALVLLGPGAAFADESSSFGNDDVLTLIKAGMSESVVIAKIRQAEDAAFDLTVDDLVRLKEEGVSDAVVTAMLERAAVENQSEDVFADSAPVPDGSSPWGSLQEDMGMNIVRVALETPDGPVRLRGMRGEFTASGAMGFGFNFMDYPGLTARHRVASPRPTLLVQSDTPLTGGRYFLAKLNSDTDDGVRSLKISSAKQRLKAVFGGSSRQYMEPDRDWVVEFQSEEVEDRLWRVTPGEDLEPGEYGWYVDLATGQQSTVLFDFGVD